MQVILLSRPSLNRLSQIASLHKLTLTESILSSLPTPLLTLAYLLLILTCPNVLIVTFHKSEIVGFAFAYTSLSWPQFLHPKLTGPELQFICVHPKFQNVGLGKQMLKQLNTVFFQKNSPSYLVGTKSSNLKSNALYTKLNFSLVKRIEIFGNQLNYYRSPPMSPYHKQQPS